MRSRSGVRLSVAALAALLAVPIAPASPVVAAGSTTIVAAAPNPSTYSVEVTFTATVAPADATGVVTFRDGTSELGTGTLDGTSGLATFATTALGVGSHTITAEYGGDGTYDPSASAALEQVVGKGNQTISFTSTAPSSAKANGPTYTPTATATSGLTVTFAAGPVNICRASAGIVSFKNPGTCVVSANQAGNASWNPAAPVTQSIPVTGPAATTTAVSSSLNPSTYGESVTFTAMVSPSTAAGSIQFVIDGAGFGVPVAVTSATATSGATSTLAGGMHSVVASFTPDDPVNYANSSGTLAGGQIVGKADQTVTFGALPDRTYGDAPFTVSATASSGLPVAFSSTTTPVCTLSGSTVTLIAAGTCTVRASQPGNVSYNAAVDVEQGFNVARASQTISFAQPADHALGDSPVSLTATASSGLGVAFGSLTPAVCTVSGTSVTLVAIGTCAIRASQPGNANYDPASDVDRAFAIGRDSQTITFGTLASRTYGDAPFMVSATASSGLPVAFSSTTTPVCTLSGSTVTLIAAGICTIEARQAGNDVYAAAPPVDRSFTVAKASQTVSFAPLAAITYGDAPFPVSATASSGLPVAFSSTTPSVCTVSGTLVTAVAAGTCTIRASQAGGQDWNAAASIDRGFAVGKKAATVTANDKARSYGSIDPAFDATIDGLVGADNPGTPACATTAESPKVVGRYPITCTSGSLSAANYTYTYLVGVLTVVPAALTISAVNVSRQYGLPNPALMASVAGYVLGEDATKAGLTGAAACTTDALVTDGIGGRPIRCTQGTLAAPNYDFPTFVPGILTITPALAAPSVSVDANPAIAFGWVTFTASVTWPAGKPTGTVTFFEDATALANPIVLDPSGRASALVTTGPGAQLPIGAHEITAVYSGDGANFGPATSTPFSEVVGRSTVNVSLAANRPTWETNVPITFTASPVPEGTGVTIPVTGTVTFEVDGVAKATVQVSGGSAAYTWRPLTAGSHTVTATYATDAVADASFIVGAPATLTKTVVVNTVSASGVGVSSSSIYPVSDTYRDTVSIRGTRNEPLSIAITIYSPSGSKVRTKTVARAQGAYVYAWNGRTSTGSVLAAGRYRVVQVLADAYGARKTFSSYVTLSRKRMYWYTRTIYTSPGPRHFSVSGDAAIQSQYSTTSIRPLAMAFAPPRNTPEALAWKAVGYQFTLPSASVYSWVSFQVRGSWTSSNAAPPKIGLIPWNGGSWLSMYSTTRLRRAMGSSTTGYYAQTVTSLGGIRSGRYIRASIDSFVAPTGWASGAFSYSIASVRIVVRYGILR